MTSWYALLLCACQARSTQTVPAQRMNLDLLKIRVSVETWFSGGLVVTFTDDCGVEYRGALLKRTDKLAEYKGANHELASPLSILHDHSYCQKDGKKPWKHVPAKVLLGWNTARPPLTPQRAVCKRNGFVTKSERIAIVETDNVMDNNISVGWPYFHKTDRSAKFLARLRMKDTRSIQGNTTIDMIKKKKKKKITSRAPKGSLKKKLAGPSAHKIHPPSYNTIMSSTLKLLPTVSPSLITQAQKCAVGVTPTNTFGIISPLKVHPPAGQSPFVQLSSSSSRNSSLSPTAQVKPFSITLHKIPLTRMPVLSETITLE